MVHCETEGLCTSLFIKESSFKLLQISSCMLDMTPGFRASIFSTLESSIKVVLSRS